MAFMTSRRNLGSPFLTMEWMGASSVEESTSKAVLAADDSSSVTNGVSFWERTLIRIRETGYTQNCVAIEFHLIS